MKLRQRIQAIQRYLKQRHEACDFSRVKDPRSKRGRRWSMQALMATALMALVTITRSLRGAERFSEDLAGGARRMGIKRRVPDTTLGELLSRVAPGDIRKHLHRMILAEHRRKSIEPQVLPIRAISIDGKTVATLDGEENADCQQQSGTDGRPPYWLYRVVRATLISSSAAVCIDQAPIPAATNDMGVFASFFRQLCKTYGRADLFELITADAGFASEANARLVDDAGKAYVFSLKGNQPDLEAEAWRVLGAAAKNSAPEIETDWELDSSRGWVKRQLWRSNEVAHWGAWSHLRQVWLVRVLSKQGRDGAEKVLENRLYVTNLLSARLAPKDIVKLVRAHWRIENNCFGTLDIEWQEDHGRWVRRGNGLPVVSLLRVIAYNLLELLRTVHLRSEAARVSAWRQLRDWVRDALLWPSVLDDVSPAEAAAPA